MIHYCTHFDRNYLPRALVLFRSLKRHSPPFTLWALCFDDEAHDVLTGLAEPMIRPIRISDFERSDDALLAAKANRSTVEYYFTCTPSLPLYVMSVEPDIPLITYLDADLKFFGNPQVVFDEMGSNSIGIVPHAFPPNLQHMEKFGRFNVGLVAFRNDATGHACLTRWREQCLNWCYDRVEANRYADQKYLDEWPVRYETVCILENPGVITGPWNFTQHAIAVVNGHLSVDGRDLIFYHFAGLRRIRSWVFDLGLGGFGRMSHSIRMRLYRTYIEEIGHMEGTVGLYLRGAPQPPKIVRGRSMRNRLRTAIRFVQGALMFRIGRFWF